MSGPVYALNPFDIADREQYLAYSRRSVQEVERHGGRVVALGRFLDTVGDVEGRQVLILVDWSSREAFDGYVSDPALADLHPHRERGTRNYVWAVVREVERPPAAVETVGRAFGG